MLGYGLSDDGFHGANEHWSYEHWSYEHWIIEMFHRGVETAIVYLEELAQLPPRGVDIAATGNAQGRATE